MNNIIYYNAVRKMDKKIEKDMAETVDVVKNGYRCLKNGCWLGRIGKCGKKGGKWRKECEWDLRSEWWRERMGVEG